MESRNNTQHEYITGVGIIVDNVLYKLPRPYRHHHCIKLAFDKLRKPITTASQGFITSEDRYVSREEALTIARQSGQLTQQHSHPTKLFSESIW